MILKRRFRFAAAHLVDVELNETEESSVVYRGE